MPVKRNQRNLKFDLMGAAHLSARAGLIRKPSSNKIISEEVINVVCGLKREF